MGRKTHKKRYIIGATALVLLLVSVCVLGAVCRYEGKKYREKAEYVMMGEINKLQYAIDSRLLNAKTMEMIVLHDAGIVRNFDAMAQALFTNDPSIRSLQLAPDGVVTYVYPLAGNEEAFGDLFSDPDRRADAEYARDTGEMTLAGPYELSQGGMGVVARNPIYLTKEDGKKTFWGFSVVILNVPEIFGTENLKSLEGQGYLYKIWKMNRETKEKQVILQNGKLPDEKALEGTITVPNAEWVLSIYPKDGWVSVPYMVMIASICLLTDILILLVLSAMLTTERQKKELALMANTDPLTELHNERYLMTCMKGLVKEKKSFVLYYIDLDRFKLVNDRFGHDVGDHYLTEVAGRIQAAVHPSGMAYRIGGDEFAVIAKGGREESFYEQLKQNMQKEIGKPFHAGDEILFPEASIGFTHYPDEAKDMEQVIRMADQEMYREKNEGKEREQV